MFFCFPYATSQAKRAKCFCSAVLRAFSEAGSCKPDREGIEKVLSSGLGWCLISIKVIATLCFNYSNIFRVQAYEDSMSGLGGDTTELLPLLFI